MSGNGAGQNLHRKSGAEIRVVMIVGIAINGVIGSKGDMPWHLSTDLKRFRKLTMKKPIIMGRKTFESMGRPLPGRHNIIVTRSGFKAQGTISARNLEEGLELAHSWAHKNGADEVCIIGGGEIYRQSLDLCSTPLCYPYNGRARWRHDVSCN